MGHYSVLDNAREIADYLLDKAENAGDLFAPVRIGKNFGPGGINGTRICMQYLSEKKLISFSEEEKCYCATLTADIVDFAG